MQTLNRGKQDLVNAKDKIDTEKFKEKFNQNLKNIKETNNINKETLSKFSEKFSFLYSNKIKNINNYVGSNSFWKYYYEFRSKSKLNFSLFKKNPVENTKISFKDFFSFKKTFFFGSIKNRMKVVAFKCFLLFIGYLGLKIIYHRAIYGNGHNDKYEIMNQLKELKLQNDEIIKRNKELLEENRSYRGI